MLVHVYGVAANAVASKWRIDDTPAKTATIRSRGHWLPVVLLSVYQWQRSRDAYYGPALGSSQVVTFLVIDTMVNGLQSVDCRGQAANVGGMSRDLDGSKCLQYTGH